MREILLSCPLCGTPKFTARGLRAHWCKAKGPSKWSKTSAPLTREEWQAAVDAARAKASRATR